MKLSLCAFLSTLTLLVSMIVISGVSAQEAQPADQPAAHDLANNPEFKAAFEEAMKKFVGADFNGALEILKGVYEKQPGIVPPRVAMARLFANSNVRQGVHPSLEMATKETPNDPEAYLLLADMALRQRSWTAADLLVAKADTLVAAYNANAERKKNLGIIALRLHAALSEAREDWAGMQKHLTDLLALQGETPVVYRQLGACLFQQKQDAPSREMFVKAQQLQGEGALPADALLAQLYLQRGDTDNARKSLDAALKEAPNSLDVHAMNVMFYLSDNKLEDAKAAVEKLYQIDWKQAQDANKTGPDGQPEITDNTMRLVATVALYRGEYLVAENFFEKLILKSPGDAASANGLALALCEQTETNAQGEVVPNRLKLQRAAEYAASNVQKNQNNREFLGTLAWVLLKAGQKQQALEIIKRAVADGQMAPDTAFYLAKLSVEEKNFEQARGLLTSALAIKRPFLKRAEAEKLFAELPPAPATPATN